MRSLRSLALITITLGICACSVQPKGKAPMSAVPSIDIFSAGPGSAFLPYAQGLGAYLATQGVAATVRESKGSIENLELVDASPTRLGLAFLGTAYEGVNATAEWTKGRKLSNVRALFPMYETSFQMVALKSTSITSLAQLHGKRVGVGPAGGPAESFFTGLADAVGVQAIRVNGTPAALVADLNAGRIDALWQGASLPIPSIKQVADANDAVVFGLSENESKAMLQRFPFLTASVVPGNTYRGQPKPVESVAAWNFVVANRALPDTEAYRITRAVLEAKDPQQMLHASAGPTRAENAGTNSVLPFHPGALRYYRERNINRLN